eukprot:CAMPEP_0169262902 /NCGR_PEP_ID=MMETSP1016-20121227/44021_1 /TAXON_ID=342587 /ORGANISM="Karlodinium micrum, Strain CCMP2283" /LENGTH=173 /DNA_ID=CAMNT_0009345591 /DNA_START=83 /DNA_END=600 /DNA_ORIENTATION=+
MAMVIIILGLVHAGGCAIFVALKDSPLTEIGHDQARALHDRLHENSRDPLHTVEVIISSPLSRCIETTVTVFRDSKAPRCVSNLHTERCIGRCDCGVSRQELATKFADAGIDKWEGFQDLPEVWWPNDRSCCQELKPLDRVNAFKQKLLERSEKRIAVVGHAGFFGILTGHHM